MGLAQRITKKMPKDEIWQEVLERSKSDDFEFTPSEIKIIRFYFWGKSDKRRKVKGVPVIVTGRVNKTFKNMKECGDYFGVKSEEYIRFLCETGRVTTRGRMKGCSFDWLD